VRIRLYNEPRGWNYACEVDYLCELNGDVDLYGLEKVLGVNGKVRVSSSILRVSDTSLTSIPGDRPQEFQTGL
jgi:hypothetical protein